jgi:hypothetical protein
MGKRGLLQVRYGMARIGEELRSTLTIDSTPSSSEAGIKFRDSTVPFRESPSPRLDPAFRKGSALGPGGLTPAMRDDQQCPAPRLRGVRSGLRAAVVRHLAVATNTGIWRSVRSWYSAYGG